MVWHAQRRIMIPTVGGDRTVVEGAAG